MFSPPTGTFQDSVDVTLSSATAGATIFYTTDGSDPTAASEVFSTPINITATTTVKAFAIFTDYFDSAITSATYTIDTTPPIPGIIDGAPSLDQTLIYNVALNTEFLYNGPNAVQTGVTAGTIEPLRAAVTRGQVLDGSGNAISGVTVKILNHTEFGSTATRSDGFYDMAVNGGQELVLQYEKAGFLPAQRKVDVPVQDFLVLDDVVLVPPDPLETTVDLTSAQIQVAQSTLNEPGTSKERQATLLFLPGTTATMVVGGTNQAITSPDQFKVRATEYTVEGNGPEALPAELPSAAAYVYAVELSVEEARNAGAELVDFNKDVIVYVQNFIDLPPGSAVVSQGVYNSKITRWKSKLFGRAVNIINIVTPALPELPYVELDWDSDGIADDTDTLIGTTLQERETLATLFAVGQSLWRMPVSSFGSNTFSLGFGLEEEFIQ